MQKKYALVGLGNRSHSYLIELFKSYSDLADIVALYDIERYRSEDAMHDYGFEAKIYDNYDDLLKTSGADTIIICSPESAHTDQIIKALDAGYGVITEKPLCLTETEAQGIIDAEKRNGRPIFMGFNYRHIPLMRRIREIIATEKIGQPVSIDLSWYLDFKGHGLSYFRRWHRLMKLSGGLLITKATHHFDLASWWMGDTPETVYAQTRQNFFGPKNTHLRDRFNLTPIADKDVDLEKLSQELGYSVGRVRNYRRDYDPWGEDVDIPDTMAVIVSYKNGGILNYSLNASVPYEGWNLAINGTGGRIESGITDAKPDPGIRRNTKVMDLSGNILGSDQTQFVSWPEYYRILFMPHWGEHTEELIPNIADGHGGGDYAMFDLAFGRREATDHEKMLGLFPSAIDGAYSVAIGDAANRSSAQGKPVKLTIKP